MLTALACLPSAGGGWSLVASRTVNPGELLLALRPAAITNDRAVRHAYGSRMASGELDGSDAKFLELQQQLLRGRCSVGTEMCLGVDVVCVWGWGWAGGQRWAALSHRSKGASKPRGWVGPMLIKRQHGRAGQMRTDAPVLASPAATANVSVGQYWPFSAEFLALRPTPCASTFHASILILSSLIFTSHATASCTCAPHTPACTQAHSPCRRLAKLATGTAHGGKGRYSSSRRRAAER